ncbi:SUMF1/EgtB/PvdO family nonheme iron enzyme [Desulfobacterales bacterium HSG16]|nr:SUMF1/EgtB/PvdO family nonheme iron enzyme [Desulfobacterales bacterium HSG16]
MCIVKSCVILILLAAFLICPAFAGQQGRVALLIGNEDYRSSPLLNPVNDANGMGDVLEGLGFTVSVRKNLNWQEMNEAIVDFGGKMKNSELCLFYYAGHGVQIDGKNYLIPVDSDIRHEKEVKYKAIDAELVLAEMGNSENRTNIVILDACRGNPFSSKFRTSSKGLTHMAAPSGTLIAYSTGPGKKAGDGSRNHSLYTEELIKHIEIPGSRLVDVFSQVRKAVRERTGGRQIPWESTSLEGAVYLGKVESAELPVSKPVSVSQSLKVDKKAKTKINLAQSETVIKEAVFDQPPAGAMKIDTVTQMNFSWIPGGCYPMGCGSWTDTCDADEKPVHKVCVDGLWVGIYEVTYKQFLIFLNEVNDPGLEGEAWFQTRDNDPEGLILSGVDGYTVEAKYLNHPVTNVSWYGAKAFVSWLSNKTGNDFNLPTEAEWEYIARSGGLKEKYAGGDDIESVAWCVLPGQQPDSMPHVVGTKSPNGLGIYDMSGNVWEWCRDIYREAAYAKHEVDNPVEYIVNTYKGNGSARVIRGGSFLYDSRYSRSSNRGSHWIAGHTSDLGFRVVMRAADQVLAMNN